MDESYILTIITVTYNAENEVIKTLESVVTQNLLSDMKVEYIVQDGGSKDNTLEFARSYKEQLSSKGIDLLINCESDKGIYDAMNKGIEQSKGKWICLLNAGDRFYDENSLNKLLKHLKESSADVLYSDYQRSNKYIRKNVSIPELIQIEETMIFCHQAVFIRDYVYKNEKYNQNYNLVADYDLMLRLYLNNYRFKHIEEILIDYDTEGISASRMVETYKEIYKVRLEHGTINKTYLEMFKYYFGILKRVILSIIPQSLRWKIYKFVKK